MNIYIITLINKKTRIKNALDIKNKLKEFFDVLIVPACIPGSDIRLEKGYDSEFRARKLGYDLTAGELGCFQSHQNVWRNFIDSDNELCCVLEDDAVVNNNFNFAVNAATSCNDKWDICRLHCSFDYGINLTVCAAKEYSLSYNVIPPRGTTGYLMSRKAAKTLLEKSSLIREPVDHFVDNVRIHGLTVLSLRPYPVSVIDSLPSEIGHRGWDTSIHGKRTFRRRMQRDLLNFYEQIFCFKKAIFIIYVKFINKYLNVV